MIRTMQLVLVGSAVAATVAVIAYVDQGSHSVSDTLYGSAIYVMLIWVVAGIAFHALGRRNPWP
jgi:glycerol uptake facilitator-like aquaporin